MRNLVRTGWAVAFLLALIVPLGLYAEMTDDLTPIMRLALGLGILAVSVLAAVVVLSARLRSLTGTLGIGTTVGVHRYLGSLLVVLVVGHVGLVIADDPGYVRLLWPLTGTPASRAGLAAAIALIALAVANRLRRHRYELWRWIHIALTATALILTGLHVIWLRHLVADPAMRYTFMTLGFVVLGVLAWRWVWRPASRGAGYRVTEVRHDTASIATVVLSPNRARHGRGPHTLSFAPGQFAWLRLARSRPSQEHPFTIASSAHDPDRMEFTLRHTGDFSATLAGLTVGSKVYVDGPHGSFTPDPSAPGLVLIAAGVGMTPMMSMLRTLTDRHDRRPHRLIQAAGTEDDLLFRPELARMVGRLPLSTLYLLRRPPPGWTGASGRVTAEMLRKFLPGPPVSRSLHFYVCGPDGLIADAVAALADLKIPASHVHTEQFDEPLRGPDDSEVRAMGGRGGARHRAAGSGSGVFPRVGPPTGRHHAP